MVRTISGANSEYSGLRCGREVVGILSRITSSDSHENTGGDNSGGSGVQRGGTYATLGQVDDSAVRAASGHYIVGDKVNTSNNARSSTFVWLVGERM